MDMTKRSTRPRDRFTGREVTIVHFHLGKTGGTALNSLMQRAFPNNCRIQTDPEDPPPPLGDSSAYISGHWPPARYPELLEADSCCKVILLRHPLFLVASNYRQLVRDGNFGRSPLGCALPPAIGDMVRMLQQWFDGDPDYEHPARRYFDNVQVRFILGKYTGQISQTDVDRAITILDQIDVVGITERFRQFCRLLALRVSQIGNHAVEWANISASISQDYISLALDDINYLTGLCSYDWSLYNYGLRRLHDGIPLYAEAAEAPEAEEEIPLLEPSLTLPQLLFQSRQSATGIILDGFQLDGDRMFLHAPPPGAPPATVEFDSVEFTGERNVQLEARLDNTDAEEVILSVTVWSDKEVSFTTSLHFAPGEEKNVGRISTPPLIGQKHVTITSRMVSSASTNDYAWLWIKRLEFF
jgi:hypothetical protein